MGNFIITDSFETANALMDAGFQIIQTMENSYLFLNDPTKKMVFSEDGKKLQFTYTHKLMF